VRSDKSESGYLGDHVSTPKMNYWHNDKILNMINTEKIYIASKENNNDLLYNNYLTLLHYVALRKKLLII